ncbi:AAA family ATPase, partial [Armatimonadetes bacterium]|nr:AAA family ATPase [bacterium]
GPPVTCANKATYYDLFGKIEYLNEAGVFVTDFSCIQPGLFHGSNGGYMILDINDLICSKLIWDKFKKCLSDKKIGFDNIREQLGALPIKTILPKEMPLDIQVILIGDEATYEALHIIDSEFKIIFPFHLILPESVDANEINLATYAAYLRNNSIDESAMKKLIEYCLKSTGNKKKLSTNLLELDQLLSMCAFFAKENGQQFITEQEVCKSEEALNQYQQIHRKAIEELIINGQILIETTGKKVGQINALSVSSFTDYAIAYPIRITANSCSGEDGIISIEKENKMSGKVFGKGLSIITSYLNAMFAKDKRLSVNCTLCFEQMYGGIEGDSASCAEIYAILSNLSQIPLDQGIAITGSVDQFGNVQPIGSVSHKIDGFYQICKRKGLTGKQGVIVPYTNTEEILLPDEILRAIQENKFHIYSINKIEDGLPVLMGASFEKVKKAAMNLSIH